MSSEARNCYFGLYWPNACQAKRWNVKDEITALFCYLDHLAKAPSLSRGWIAINLRQGYGLTGCPASTDSR